MLDVANPPSGGPDPVVLVVDDQAPVRKELRAGLQRLGFEVQSAANGRDAIESYYELSQKNRAAAVTVLLDVQMPGLDGPLVLAALQAIDPNVRTFFMTGDPDRNGEDDLLALGAGRVFAKPLDLPAVAAELRRGARAEDRAAAVIVSAG